MKRPFLIYLIVSVVLGAACMAVLQMQGLFYSKLATAVLFSVCIFTARIGAVWYFLTSLKTFQPSLKVAYYLLVAGLIVQCIEQVQLPLTLLLQNFSLNIAPVQTLLFLYSVSTLVIYVGMRRFARRLQVQSIWNHFWFATACAVLAIVATALLPQPDFGSKGASYLVFGLTAWAGTFSIAAAMETQAISKAISSVYQPAMRYLRLALAVLAAGYFLLIITQTVGHAATALSAYNTAYNNFSLMLVPFAFAGFLFLRAGQFFKAIGQQYGTLPEQATVLDVVMYAAQLASDSRAIDPALDIVRRVTVTRSADEPFTATEQQRLKVAYLQIEDYLVTKELVRTFDRAELRARLPHSFRQLLTQ